jgi:hypothetical protein
MRPLLPAMSADGKRRATLNSRNCGATTAFFNTLSVSVPELGRSVEALGGELCIGRSDDVYLQWEGDDLLVACRRESCCPERIESKTETVGKTRIRFVGFERPKTN